MAKRTCSVEGCGKPRAYADGLCGMHHQRLRRHGSLERPGPPECRMQGCTKSAVSLGLCGTHYMRWRRHGDPAIRKNLVGESPETRFWDKVNKDGPRPEVGQCWEFTGATSASGYGELRVEGRAVKAHRVAYELFVEPIPDGMEIDHICRNRSCVNPLHLRVVRDLGQASNTANANLAKTECPRGHAYDSYRQSGARRCSECERIQRALRWEA